MIYRFALLFIVSILTAVSAQAQAERVISNTYELDPDGKVTVDTYKGSIHIEGWDKAMVSMEARIESHDDDEDDARESTEMVDILVDSHQGSFRVETSYDRLERKRDRHSFWSGWSHELPSVHYTLKVPRGATVVVDDYKSSSDITGLTSTLTFETYKGDARVKDHRGRIRLETYKGDIDVDFPVKPFESSFETYKGDITVRLPRESGFDVRLDLGRRADLVSDFDIEERRSRWDDDDDRRFGDSVNGGGPQIRFESTKGTIRLDAQ